MNRRPEVVIQFLISCALLSFLIFFVRIDRIKTVFSRCNEQFLLLAIALLPFVFWIRAYRWALIINRGERHFPIRHLFSLILTGVALNFVIPGSLGEVGRFYFGARAFGHREEMISSSITDKLYGLFSIFLLGGGISFFFYLPDYGVFSLGLAFILGVLLVTPNLFPWGTVGQISEWLFKQKLDSARMIQNYTLSFKRKLMVILISLLSWLGTCFLFFLVCISFQSKAPFLYLLAVTPLIILARLFPLTLNGFGSQEAVMIYLFHRIGISGEVALLASLALQLILTVIPAIVGICLISLFRSQTTVKEIVAEKT